MKYFGARFGRFEVSVLISNSALPLQRLVMGDRGRTEKLQNEMLARLRQKISYKGGEGERSG